LLETKFITKYFKTHLNQLQISKEYSFSKYLALRKGEALEPF